MAQKLHTYYPDRFDAPSSEYPQGKWRNRSSSTAHDAGYLDQGWLNDQYGFLGKLLREGGITPDGTIDTALKSQYFDALVNVINERVKNKRDVDDNVFDGHVSIKSDGSVRGRMSYDNDGLQFEQVQEDGTQQIFTFPKNGEGGEFVLKQELANPDMGATMVGFKQAGVGAVERTVKDSLEEWVSIKDYGAIGDGIVDDSHAFAAADVSDYAVIYVPEGLYNIGAYLPTKLYFGPGKLRIASGATRSVALTPQTANYLAPNTVVGAAASQLGTFNTLFGYNVGWNFGQEAKQNTLIGHNLASGDTIEPETNAPFTGSNNVGIGYHALKKNQTGFSNVGIGGDALNENKTGNHNVAIGQAAGQQVIHTNDNVFIGSASGGRTETGRLVTYVGRNAGRENRSGQRNAVFGWTAGQGITPSPTTATGDGVTKTFTVNGGYNFTQVKQVRVDIDGLNILPANYTVAGSSVTFLEAPESGSSILFTPTIGSGSYSYSTVLGAQAGQSLNDGDFNTLVGYGAGQANKSGARNTVIGSEAGNMFEGSDNVLIGYRAARSTTILNNRIIITNHASLPFFNGTCLGADNPDNVLRMDSVVTPATDNTRVLGSSLYRWQLIFSASGAIETSDAREKQQQRDLTDVERTVAQQLKPLLKAFKWNDSVFKKGDKARWHFGVMAQEVAQVFTDNGLDAHDYALFCYDEWDETPEIKEPMLDDEGNETGEFEVIQEYQPSGNRYGIRYSQLLAFIISAM